MSYSSPQPPLGDPRNRASETAKPFRPGAHYHPGTTNGSGRMTLVPDLVCLSHLRWGFVFQRPQHLMNRFARHQRVFFVEEPMYGATAPSMDVRLDEATGVHVCVPQLQHGLTEETQTLVTKLLLDNLLLDHGIREFLLWYYTPMALSFSHHLQPRATVYDCMDELSGFKFAPPALRENEAELFRRSDVVFTGGQSLYESKRKQHANAHPFPSSVEVQHFAQAVDLRAGGAPEPADQAAIPHPRIGFCGVIDERMDLDLIAGAAAARPDWHFVMVGPVVKIDPASLPRLANIHYLGGKGYQELPAYFAGWDAAILPFAHNDATRFISPTKTPEYLAAGLPVVSTSIRDVVRPYGDLRLVRIADGAPEFVAAIDACLNEDAHDPEWRRRVERQLALNSWDLTWQGMTQQIADALKRNAARLPKPVRAAELVSGD